MDPLAESFIDYDDNFINFDILRDANFYVASPDSASTQTKTNSYSPELQNSCPSGEQIFFEQPSYICNFPPQRSESPPEGIISNHNGYINQNTIDAAAFQANFNEKVADKSKRITKRNIAKERTKNRQEATASLSIHNVYDQEMAENQDFEDVTQKKMALKMKNRIAAQNSRDRKKIYTQQLEEANSQLIQENMTLHQEKDMLNNEISKLRQNEARLVKEIDILKTSNACPSCGNQSNRGPSYDEESNNFHPISYGQPVPENLGSLSSPILARFPSAGRKMFTFLTLACFTALILLANVHQKGEVELSGPLTLPDRGLMEFSSEGLEQHKDLDSDDEHDHDHCNRQDSLLASTTEKLKDLLLDTSLTKVLSTLDDSESTESLSRQNSVNKNEIEWDQVCLKTSESDSAQQKFNFDPQESDSCLIEHIEAEEVLFLKKGL